MRLEHRIKSQFHAVAAVVVGVHDHLAGNLQHHFTDRKSPQRKYSTPFAGLALTNLDSLSSHSEPTPKENPIKNERGVRAMSRLRIATGVDYKTGPASCTPSFVSVGQR
jgi:hypothetical protein